MKTGQADRRDAVLRWLRRRGRKILQSLALAVLVLLCAVRRLLPPSARSVDKKWREQERRRIACHSPDPTSSLVLAPPAAPSRDREKTVAPSKLRLLRHMRQVWVLRAILTCMILSALCLGILALCSRVRVTSVQCLGMQRYSAEELIATAGVQSGDEWYGVDTEHAQAALLAAYPYLQSAAVTRTERGTVRIDVTERTPAFVVVTADGAVLLDSSLYVLETFSDGMVPAELCLLENIPVTPDSAVEPGKRFPLPERYAAWLRALASATTDLPCGVVRLDATDPYALTLYLSDGTRIFFGDTKDAERKLSAAVEVLRRAHASASDETENAPWTVNVSDPMRVTVGKTAEFDR